MNGNGVKVISAVMAEMLHEKSVEMVTVTVMMTMMMIGSGSRSRRSWYKSSHTTDSVWASYPTQRPGNIR